MASPTSSRSTAPPPRAVKRMRIRKCGRVLHMPLYDGSAENVTFTCQLEQHGPDTDHCEHGYVFLPNGTGREFRITWSDVGVVSARRKLRELTK